ncbi:unnamed protein product [Bursaphelenchus okinawaensis]|uniref:Uncharacterized protein n=1 Tax=Bursaphelenchus okinawaensis TaxID=465554 RepID=A0A811LPP4_9BILA|nr:unnamed protein product [Bursaphelenchus okinawaensis]CAG9127099.1 unnamed protein product [Bursaphelenchus okinawaensis]
MARQLARPPQPIVTTNASTSLRLQLAILVAISTALFVFAFVVWYCADDIFPRDVSIAVQIQLFLLMLTLVGVIIYNCLMTVCVKE